MSEIYSKLEISQARNSARGLTCESGGVAGQVERSEDLPCLYSNNSIEPIHHKDRQTANQVASFLSPYHKKQALVLADNTYRLIQYCSGLDYVGFFTLTFKDNVTDPKEAYRRFRSFNNNWLSKYEELGIWISVKERQKRGAIHFHILIQVKGNIREGFDFDKYREWLKSDRRLKSDFPTGNPYIRQIWKDLKTSLEKYGFGMIYSFEPIESNARAMSLYVGKYISKDLNNPDERDKGMRKVTYSRNWPKSSVKLAWLNENSIKWRSNVAKFAEYHGCSDLYQLKELLGPNWSWKYIEDIIWIDIARTENYLENGSHQHCSEYQDKKIKETKNRKEKRDLQEKKTLNLVAHIPKIQRIKEEARQRVAVYKEEYVRVRKKKFQKDEIPF